MCSCSKQAINRVCFWTNEGIYGSAEEEKVEMDDEDKLAYEFKKSVLPELDQAHIDEILNSKVDQEPMEEEKKELDSDEDD